MRDDITLKQIRDAQNMFITKVRSFINTEGINEAYQEYRDATGMSIQDITLPIMYTDDYASTYYGEKQSIMPAIIHYDKPNIALEMLHHTFQNKPID